MASTVTVSTAVLREKARRIRALAQEQLEQHRILSEQIDLAAARFPADVRDAHACANSGWREAVDTRYSNYIRLAVNMELAADWYDWLDQHVIADR